MYIVHADDLHIPPPPFLRLWKYDHVVRLLLRSGGVVGGRGGVVDVGGTTVAGTMDLYVFLCSRDTIAECVVDSTTDHPLLSAMPTSPSAVSADPAAW